MSFVRIVALLLCVNFCECSLQGEEVSKWANTIGDQLWMLGKEVTKSTEIEQNYGHLNARVEVKDPEKLLEEIKGNILRMMDRKMDAITCIQQKAETVAENYTWDNSNSSYYSSKWSFYAVEDTFHNITLPTVLNKTDNIYRRYRPMFLNNDTHFYNIPVNTSYSSVHVPTNVYDREANVAEVLEWSEALDEVFAQNYKSDPALSWQYFGSSTGIMRHYPAMHWSSKKKEIQTLFDCRIRTWYIEAATCTKDVVILFDNSGSMDAMGKHIATLTAFSILDTFSNNDYVNILNYSDTTSYLVPCFAGELVQATEENILIFKQAIRTLKPDGKTGVEQALGTAFELLQTVIDRYRERRGCNDVNNQNCNQAIMILTDGVNANYSEIVMRYNWLENNKPVRIFTYLIGQEVTNVQEIKWLSCANRGYYSYVPNLEQVTASVMEYINVIARPMVLQEEEHPVSWTHAYADVTYDDATDTTINEPYRLLTSAAIPLFDKKINKKNDTRTALLLGVAATDVPIDEFRKLTTPYKIGVNGYAFIVSNNGYVLMHPDLRPVFKNMLKENYNSIDFTEVEQIDEDFPPRDITKNKLIQELRDSLVNGESGNKLNVKLKYHYDDYKRVAEETYDYYYTPLENKPLNINTPFSLAIAIPNTYGKYEITPSMDQIKKYQFSGDDLRTYLRGNNWKIHPKWWVSLRVYCRYHYLEGHEFATKEEELLHFLGEIYNSTFKWQRQYEPMVNETISDVECGRKTLGDDDYYCDRQLFQRLIFDATNTYASFGERYTFQSKAEEDLFNDYNVSLRFVATMSGLTRWDDFSEIKNTRQPNKMSNTAKRSTVFEATDEDKTIDGHESTTEGVPKTADAKPVTQKETMPKPKNFGDVPLRAIDEKWYKSAVLQHRYDTDSFVYSVPFSYDNLSEVLVTGSFAIFVKESGKEAPGCVVGYQFSHAKFAQRVREITGRLSPKAIPRKDTADRFIPRRSSIEAAQWHLSQSTIEQNTIMTKPIVLTELQYLNTANYVFNAQSYKEQLWSTAFSPGHGMLNFKFPKSGFQKLKKKTKLVSDIDWEGTTWPAYPRSKPLIKKPSTILDLPDVSMNTYDHIIDWGKNGQIATIFHGEVHLWTGQDAPTTHTSTFQTVKHCVKWNKSGTLFAVGREGAIISIIDASTLKYTTSMKCPCFRCLITAIEWSHDGNILIFGCSFGFISAVFLKEGRTTRRMLSHSQLIDIQLSCNESYLAVSFLSGSSLIIYWNRSKNVWGQEHKINTGGLLSNFNKCIAFHPWKESIFVHGTFKHIAVFNLNDPGHLKKPVSIMDVPNEFYLDCLTFNPLSAELLASFYYEHPQENLSATYLTVLSDYYTIVDEIQSLTARVPHALWDGTGTKLATASADENLAIWDFFGTNTATERKFLNRNKKKPTLEFFETVKIFNCCIR